MTWISQPHRALAVLLLLNLLLPLAPARAQEARWLGRWILDEESTLRTNAENKHGGKLSVTLAKKAIKSGYQCSLSADGMFEQQMGEEKSVTPFKLLKDSAGQEYLVSGLPGLDPTVWEMRHGEETLTLAPIVTTDTSWRHRGLIYVLKRPAPR
jgi:hypothetical protein